MDLLLFGAGMGIVGGLVPSPLHFIALAQVALRRWALAIFILIGPMLMLDGVLLLITFFFYQYIPRIVAHGVAYVGGSVLIAFAVYSLFEIRKKGQEDTARSATLTYAGVSAGLLAELTAPGTWVYWLTIAGPLLAEGRQRGYWHIVPFFVGGVTGFYGAAIVSVALMAWGASLYQQLKRRLVLAANIMLLVFGIYYLIHAYLYR